MLNAYIYEGKRTPFGRYAGTLAKVRPDDLLAGAIKAVLAGSKFKAEQIEDIVVGCANRARTDFRSSRKRMAHGSCSPCRRPEILRLPRP